MLSARMFLPAVFDHFRLMLLGLGKSFQGGVNRLVVSCLLKTPNWSLIGAAIIC